MIRTKNLKPLYFLLKNKNRYQFSSKSVKDINNTNADPYAPKNEEIPLPSDTHNINYDNGFDDKSESNSSGNKLYAFAIGSSLLGLLYFLQKMNTMRDKSLKARQEAKQKFYGKPDIGGSWNLTDVDGNTLSSQDLKGSYYVVYFGFCKCPDICPQSLVKLTKAFDQIKKMKESSYFDLKLVFVSVDPDRDNPKTIKKFLNYFSPNIIGIAGLYNDDPRLKDMMKKFKIYATKIEFETEDEKGNKEESYTLDHTVISYLMNDENEYLTHLGSSLSAKDLAGKIVDHITEDQNAKIYR